MSFVRFDLIRVYTGKYADCEFIREGISLIWDILEKKLSQP